MQEQLTVLASLSNSATHVLFSQKVLYVFMYPHAVKLGRNTNGL